MAVEPERTSAVSHLPPEALEELFTLFVGGFLRSRATKREARRFLAECDAVAEQMETARPLIRPAQAAVRAAAYRRQAVAWYRRARPDLEGMI